MKTNTGHYLTYWRCGTLCICHVNALIPTSLRDRLKRSNIPKHCKSRPQCFFWHKRLWYSLFKMHFRVELQRNTLSMMGWRGILQRWTKWTVWLVVRKSVSASIPSVPMQLSAKQLNESMNVTQHFCDICKPSSKRGIGWVSLALSQRYRLGRGLSECSADFVDTIVNFSNTGLWYFCIKFGTYSIGTYMFQQWMEIMMDRFFHKLFPLPSGRKHPFCVLWQPLGACAKKRKWRGGKREWWGKKWQVTALNPPPERYILKGGTRITPNCQKMSSD